MTQTPDTLSDLQRDAVADLGRAGSVAALAAAIKLERAREALAQATPPTAEVAAARDQVAAMLDNYHAPTLLLAAVKCERAALLDQARAGEWIERSGRLRELARAASAIGC